MKKNFYKRFKNLRKKPNKKPKEETLCWFCANTNAKQCSWFKTPTAEPVPGWDATKTKVCIRNDKKNKKKFIDTYQVNTCPNFIFDEKYQNKYDKESFEANYKK